MIRNVEAVYERGVLRPLELLALTESQRVQITISELPGSASRRDLSIVERAQAEATAAGVFPTIEEVRSALEFIPGSLSQDVIVARGDY
jgi:predicted DNA-binding antitoxin AbrB/MazE fold protein